MKNRSLPDSRLSANKKRKKDEDKKYYWFENQFAFPLFLNLRKEERGEEEATGEKKAREVRG